ncbi:hypothetical protein AGABI1DRAFT_105546 [Agaricus bisporus var. burnettii JB137-S8]|uniref:F-box domain-containing protein n=1 Tax=Agaricus bisporus var. burnettii (strain JB137-S8 / ATCC MYA-4627 / FGSC 10392) TaxID=597362 RepID=K5XG82_AGABU|nr:uncharacterized protein AGABI1DRAFT_105546 [Agaricus bisporus var. burnettii JB137-S8]EKM82257.1 hypothetical protein AGABI1DRAFT_105546 [Agaricus bisporus var. burnettii JB137-S8]
MHAVMTLTIPADIWITIFECIEEPAHLAHVVLVCSKFKLLATKILLKNLVWTKDEPTRRNLADWDSLHSDLRCLPRRLKLGVSFEGITISGIEPVQLTALNALYNDVVQQISKFSMLEELVFSRTIISPVIYQLIASLPKLRILDFSSCTFLNQDPHGLVALPETEYTSNITHLVLQNNTPPRDQTGGDISDHPLHRLVGHSLRSLSITWSPTSSLLFGTQRWRLPRLAELCLHVTLLTRDLMDSAVEFVNNCTAGPDVFLRVNKHNIPDNQISSTNVPMPGLKSFWGPLPVVGMFAGASSEVEHVTVTESLEITHLLAGLERLSRNIRTLDLQLRKYDNEVLFAVRQLFPCIESVSVKFGKGNLPENIMVMLGSDILPDLKLLRSLRLAMDVNCIPPQPPADYNAYFLMHALNQPAPEEENIGPGDATSTLFDPADLKDYLVGWNRYCPMLRTVQLTSVAVWHRRFEGDPWIEKTIEPAPSTRNTSSRQNIRRSSDLMIT